MLLALSGCGSSTSAVDPAAQSLLPLETSPLTVEIWKQHTGVEKFDPEIVYRLRTENPEFKSKEEWAKFTNEVLNPAFTEETGGTPPKWR